MVHELLYNGKELTWKSQSYKASSGMKSYQLSKHQCLPDRGPVPEGNYYIPLIEGGAATDDGTGRCNLSPSWQIQTIPRGAAAGACEPFWANWGHNRVRFEPADTATKIVCRPIKRGGFYLHDSTKGYSHGCIEVERALFTKLRAYIKISKKSHLNFKVKYSGGSTYGGTKIP
jgi:hypothetical protein